MTDAGFIFKIAEVSMSAILMLFGYQAMHKAKGSAKHVWSMLIVAAVGFFVLSSIELFDLGVILGFANWKDIIILLIIGSLIMASVHVKDTIKK